MAKPPYVRWLDTSTVKHLRLPFSFFLMPVFLFALSQARYIQWGKTILAFLILYGLIFPSSNGYNSYQDRDETSIGGLKYPPKVTRNLYHVTLVFDIIGILAGLFISVYFSLFVLVFIIMSRAYSYRGIRLKKYPVLGFLTVFIFQGGFVYLISASAISPFYPAEFFTSNSLICMTLSSLFLGSAYPLTQIYQHEADKNDGVISLSYKLGYKGTFFFSSALFIMASILLFYYLKMNNLNVEFFLFVFFVFPVVLTLSAWFNKVRRNSENANFENTMRMNIINSCCMNLYFLVLVLNHMMSLFK
jgi:1,4-dihydroxy-2-naphthoate polyprenyltransferase